MEKLYSTHTHLFRAVLCICVLLAFVTWGVVELIGFVWKLNWPSVSGLIVLCEQRDEFVVRRNKPGKRQTHEKIIYEFNVHGRNYQGKSIEVLSEREGWIKGSRRVLIDRSSLTPVMVWYNPSDPTVNRIDKPGVLEFPWWPWVGVIIALGAALTQFREYKTSRQLNSSIPCALQNAQLEALKRRIGRRAS